MFDIENDCLSKDTLCLCSKMIRFLLGVVDPVLNIELLPFRKQVCNKKQTAVVFPSADTPSAYIDRLEPGSGMSLAGSPGSIRNSSGAGRESELSDRRERMRAAALRRAQAAATAAAGGSGGANIKTA